MVSRFVRVWTEDGMRGVVQASDAPYAPDLLARLIKSTREGLTVLGMVDVLYVARVAPTAIAEFIHAREVVLVYCGTHAPPPSYDPVWGVTREMFMRASHVVLRTPSVYWCPLGLLPQVQSVITLAERPRDVRSFADVHGQLLWSGA